MPKKLEEYTQPELVKYVGELRGENQELRSVLTPFDDPTRRALLNMLKIFGEDQRAGAELFQDVAGRILRNTKPAASTDNGLPKEDSVSDGNETDPLAEVLALLKKQDERLTAIEEGRAADTKALEEQQLDQALEYVKSLGYVPGTKEWDDFVTLASSDVVDGDLDRAHAMFKVLYPDVEIKPPAAEGGDDDGKGDEGSEGAEGDEDGEGDDGKTKSEFPKTAGKGTTGGPKLDTKQDEGDLDLSRSAVDERALAYLEGVIASDA